MILNLSREDGLEGAANLIAQDRGMYWFMTKMAPSLEYQNKLSQTINGLETSISNALRSQLGMDMNAMVKTLL